MKINEIITEVFEPGKTNWKWRHRGSEEATADFTVGERTYQWHAYSHVRAGNPTKWEMQFRLIRNQDDPEDLDLFGTTGTGNSADVLSTAVDITRAFLQQYGLDKVEEITFSAKENSRIALYAKMIKRLLPGWDLYQKYTEYNGMEYHLTDRRAYDKPENKISETVEYNGITLRVTKPTSWELKVEALDDWGNKVLGYVEFDIGDNKELDPQDLRVDDRFQGQGIAKTMYDYVKSLGYKIVRSWDQTDAGSGFWDKHRGEDVRVWETTNPDIHQRGFKHRQEIGDFLYTARADNDTGWGTQLIITAYDGKKEIAQAEFIMDEETDSLESANTWVLPDYQELGIATTMYAYAKMLGNDVVPSRIQTDQGNAMWRSWNQKKQSKHILPKGHKGYNEIAENFADGKNPQDKGDSKRHGVPTHASISTLRKVAKQGGRKGQLAHWMANMKSGRAKAKK